MTFTWTDGRELNRIDFSDSRSVALFNYDADGYRTRKVNAYITDYYYIGGVLMRESTFDDDLYYLYDENGSISGVKVVTDTDSKTYFYQKNFQGDVIGIIDENGYLVTEYVYDEWGKVLSVTGTEANGIGTRNPIRYRGYYYDTEIGFYYLNSRYYDPETGRFINADETQYLGYDGTIPSYNIFAYCLNNPIMHYDVNGKWAVGIFGSANLTLILGVSISAGIVFDDNGNIDFQWSYACPGVDNTVCVGVADAGIGGAIQVVNVDTVNDLYGVGSYMGASGGAGWYIGGDVISLSEVNNPNSEIEGLQLTGGYGIGVDIHIMQTNTKPIGSAKINTSSTHYKKITLKEKQLGGS